VAEVITAKKSVNETEAPKDECDIDVEVSPLEKEQLARVRAELMFAEERRAHLETKYKYTLERVGVRLKLSGNYAYNHDSGCFKRVKSGGNEHA
jgi:hypothetical protein